MIVVSQGTVFLGEAGSSRASACFPGVCVTGNGRWLVGMRLAPTKTGMAGQRAGLCWSDDQGHSWSEPAEPFTLPAIDGRPGFSRSAKVMALGGSRVAAVIYWVDASDPELPFFNEETEGLLDSRLFLTISEDAGETWSAPLQIDTTPFAMPTPETGPLLLLPNGEWVLQFETNKSYCDTSVWHHTSVLMFSADAGRTWPRHATVAEDPEARVFYWDQRPSVLADGTLLDLFWTFDREEAVYLNIHARASADRGESWSEIWDTGVPGQPAPAVSLPDGRIAMAYVDRTTVPIVKLRTSADGGRNWAASTELVVDDMALQAQEGAKGTMQDAWSEMAAFSIGLPTVTTLPDGDALLVWYAGNHCDHTGIRWARLRGRVAPSGGGA